MKNQRNVLIISLAVVVLLVGVFIFRRQEKNLYEKNVQVTAPTEVVNEEAEDADQKAFEETQQISEDTSLDTLENELDNTVILEEDFSDL